MAVLAVRGGARDRVERDVEGRGGAPHGEEAGLAVFGFTSPTDAVLAGLELTDTQEAACCAITAGEVEEVDGAIRGRAVEAAAELAAGGEKGEVLLVDAVFFAMNRNEVSAALIENPPANRLGQKVYRASARVAGAAPASVGPAAAPPAAATSSTWTVPLLAVLVAFAAGVGLTRGGVSRDGAGSLAEKAEFLASKEQHREAAHAFFEAYLENPGEPFYERRFREELLQAVEDFLRAGRPDAGYRLLKDAQEKDPFRKDVEERLMAVGLVYLEKLLENGSKDAFELEKVRLIESLPLDEQRIRDRVVSVHVQRLVTEWRAEANQGRKRDIALKTGPFWQESRNNPDLLLAEAEFSAWQGRFEAVRDFLGRVLDGRPGWVREKPEIPEIALECFRRMSNAYMRKNSLAEMVAFAVQRIGEPLVGPARAALGEDSVGLRNGAARILEQMGKLTEAEALEVHRRNLAGIKAVEETESPLKDEDLVRQVIAFGRGAQGATRKALGDLIERALAAGGLSGSVSQELAAAREELR